LYVVIVAAAGAFLGTVTIAYTQPGAKKAGPTPPMVRAPQLRNTAVIPLLNEPIEMRDLQVPNITLKELLFFLQDKMEKGAHPNVTIIADVEAFKDSNPDTPFLDVHVGFDGIPPVKRVPLGVVLRMALAKIPTRDATFIVRRGMILITTAERASGQALARERVAAVFDKRALSDAIQELAEITGASIVLDQRVGEERATPVSAVFANDVSLKTALDMLADMASLKVHVGEEGFYITTPENADILRKETRKLQEEQLWRKRNGLPEPGESVPGPARRIEPAAWRPPGPGNELLPHLRVGLTRR
jgi:hypothetical protein